MRDNIASAANELAQGAGSRLDADTLRNKKPSDFVSSESLYFSFNGSKWELKVKYPSGTIAIVATEP